MILVDTGVWIDYFRGRETPERFLVHRSIREDGDLCTCGVIKAEILQGIKSDQEYKAIKKDLEELIYLPLARSSYFLAAELYRACARRGKIVRSTIDCLIAACALIHDVPLLQKDKDFSLLAEVSELNLVRT